MFEKEQNFFEFVHDIFYTFSQTRSGNSKIIFSRKIQYPIIKFALEPEIVIPLPKIQDDKYVFEGIVFDNTPDDRKSLWCLFLATIYHLAAHVAVSRYSVYEQWQKNKTDDLCLRVIDFIEDIEVEKYIIHTNPDVWENIRNINSKILSHNDQEKVYNCNMPYDLKMCVLDAEEKIKKIKKEIMEKRTNQSQNETQLLFADMLYKNRELLPKTILPYCEHHKDDYAIKIEENRIEFEPSGLCIEQAEKLDELWMINEQTKSRLLRRYGKHLKGLNFDAIIIPTGNLHDFTQVKERVLPMLRRIRQQLRMITNLVDNPMTNQIGYVDMQLAIQAIASEGQSTDVFERDEPRRVEEAWAILIDKSASMGLRFDQIKEFVVCVSESANELTGKSDAWALYSFDNNFQIIKDFNEKYNQEVRARIGSLKTGGLSLMPDAIELAYKILAEDPRERKYLFVITDGHPSGYEKIQERLSKVSKKIEMSGVILVGIGVSKTIMRVFRNSARSSDLRQLVAKFITAYKMASSDM
jgi:Mg-chelatase subunit ChlD